MTVEVWEVKRPMKIVVFSDSHGSIIRMLDIIEEEKPDMLFHLGDHESDTIDLKSVYPEIPLIAVRGNNDWGSNAPDDEIVEVKGTRFFLTHGHLYSVRCSADLVARMAKSKGCQVALYGHTHIAEDEWNHGIHVANPGSITLPYLGEPSYLVIHVEDGQEAQLKLKYRKKTAADQEGGRLRLWERLGHKKQKN